MAGSAGRGWAWENAALAACSAASFFGELLSVISESEPSGAITAASDTEFLPSGGFHLSNTEPRNLFKYALYAAVRLTGAGLLAAGAALVFAAKVFDPGVANSTSDTKAESFARNANHHPSARAGYLTSLPPESISKTGRVVWPGKCRKMMCSRAKR